MTPDDYTVNLTPFCAKLKMTDKKNSHYSKSVPNTNNLNSFDNLDSIASYMQFYDAIPNYNEVHHLSDDEFYEKLQALKATQKIFNESSSITAEPHDHLSMSNCCHCQDLPGNPKIFVDPPPKSRKKKHAKSHEVPLTSKIPLFDKIMAEQEVRRRLIHAKNSQDLQAIVRPFSFTRKEEARSHMSAISTPDIRSKCCSRTPTPFRAKPVPRCLYDKGIERNREDHFHRALQRCIRADQMLKNSSLPPRMEAHSQISKNQSKSLDYIGQFNECSKLSREHSATTHSSNSNSTPDIIDYDVSRRPSRPQSTNKTKTQNNLASVLRLQSTRSRAEHNVQEDLKEQNRADLARHKERLRRMTPAWRSLNYSVDDDLEVRLEQRRQEARSRHARHEQLMDSIYGRVHQMAPLFQNPKRVVKPHECNNVRCRSLESSLNVPSNDFNKSNCRPKRSSSFYKTEYQNVGDWMDS